MSNSPVSEWILGFIFFKLIVVTILGREKPTRAAIKITPYIVFFLVMVVTLATVYKEYLRRHFTKLLPDLGSNLPPLDISLFPDDMYYYTMAE